MNPLTRLARLPVTHTKPTAGTKTSRAVLEPVARRLRATMTAVKPRVLACVTALQTETRRLPFRLTLSLGDCAIAETATAQHPAERKRSGAPRTNSRVEPGFSEPSFGFILSGVLASFVDDLVFRLTRPTVFQPTERRLTAVPAQTLVHSTGRVRAVPGGHASMASGAHHTPRSVKLTPAATTPRRPHPRIFVFDTGI